jgi:predicted transcriptional regulator
MMDYLNNQNADPVSKNSILEHVNNVYFYEYDAIQKRLEEQIELGNVIKSDKGYIITKRGELILNIFSRVTDLYNMDQNFARK